MEWLLLLCVLSPAVGCIINGLFGRWTYRAAGVIGSTFLGISFALAVPLIIYAIQGHVVDYSYYHWIVSGKFTVPFGLRLDSLSAMMLGVVTFVSFMIHIYAIGYMGGHKGYARFFTYLNLFVFAMLLLCMGNNYLTIFIGWEGVGFCSYILIGYYYEKKTAADAGRKAFVTTRIGDIGFIVGVLFIILYFGSVKFTDVFAQAHMISPATITIITLALFFGAIGKSAQFPLYVWLPDAMEGPTPVSALIHAATMVTAGVYMVARSAPLYALSPTSSLVVASVGAFTALFAATMALTHFDLKRILAYSTISQIGYMMIGVGVGAYWTGMFHLVTHAFFKALLFLSAGAVMHAMHGVLDMRLMGGLRHKMPQVCIVMIIASLAIAGIPPLSGFFSKDHILSEALMLGHPIIWLVGVVTAFMTAFYMFRMIFFTFFGESRVPEGLHPHEAPSVMLVPLWVLAVGSIVIGGILGMNVHGHISIEHFISLTSPNAFPIVHEYSETLLIIISIIAGVLGIVVAWLAYIPKGAFSFRSSVVRTFHPLYRCFFNLWWVDEIYNFLFCRPFRHVSERFLWKAVDVKIIDAGVDDVGRVAGLAGRAVRIFQTGFINNYACWVSAGALIICGWYLLKIV